MNKSEYSKKIKEMFLKKYPTKTIGEMAPEQLIDMIFAISMNCLVLQFQDKDLGKLWEKIEMSLNPEDNK